MQDLLLQPPPQPLDRGHLHGQEPRSIDGK
jgi:hypothetical protein